jgi:Uma2 family endonuclease
MNWQEVIVDKSLQNLPYKIETTKSGKIEMSPATNWHAYWQYEIAGILREQLRGQGMGFTEASIDTPEGVKVADVAWGSHEFIALNGMNTPFPKAPELCVEIISPINTKEEIDQKVRLYLEQGALEVWLCDLSGKIEMIGEPGKLEKSFIAPSFPKQLEKI